MKKTLYLFFLFIFLISSCKTLYKRKNLTEDNFERWLITAQEFTNLGRYRKALDILFETRKVFPDTEEIAVVYNIGFNYYKLKNFKEAKKYLNDVKTLFESNSNEQFVYDNRKYDVLADVIMEKMNLFREDLLDPYHIKDQIDKNRKIRPKKKSNRPKIIREK